MAVRECNSSTGGGRGFSIALSAGILIGCSTITFSIMQSDGGGGGGDGSCRKLVKDSIIESGRCGVLRPLSIAMERFSASTTPLA